MGESKRVAYAAKVVQYAAEVGIPPELAWRRVAVFDRLRILQKRAGKCPCCGRSGLYIETTDWECTYNESWVCCEHCDYTSDIVGNKVYLQSLWDFDVLCIGKDDKLGKKEKEWHAFALDDTVELERMLTG